MSQRFWLLLGFHWLAPPIAVSPASVTLRRPDVCCPAELTIAPLLLTPQPDTVTASAVRFNALMSNVPPLVMTVIPVDDPKAVATPAFSVPFRIVTPPENVLAPLKVSVPVPDWVTEPEPETSPDIVT